MKAIETHYNGYKFRSRLEARWAVFFDALGIQWLYEAEGYQVDGRGYLPDFYLPQLACLAEVKPSRFTREQFQRIYACRPAILLDGMPDERFYFGTPEDPGYCEMSLAEAYQLYQGGDTFWGVDLEMSLRKRRRWYGFYSELGMSYLWSAEYRDAVMQARGARFEYGETFTRRPGG